MMKRNSLRVVLAALAALFISGAVFVAMPQHAMADETLHVFVRIIISHTQVL
ncbi:hypothetical protein [Alloscardovia theropitheci]|uniref:hypothetical protein n=1 Tax=Alloscardovia theropitheci TaxID=2496842 RepID=UPI0013F17DE0|nr:hypothetical protein [Alloscardovia theropitheci]